LSTLYKIFVWVKREGGVKAVERLKIMALPDAMAEGIPFRKIGPQTEGSPRFLGKLRIIATKLVGKPCPV